MHFKIWYFHELLFQIRSRATCLHLSATTTAGVYLILFSFEKNTTHSVVLLFTGHLKCIRHRIQLEEANALDKSPAPQCDQQRSGWQVSNWLIYVILTWWRPRRHSTIERYKESVCKYVYPMVWTVWNISGFFSFLVSSDWTLFA